ncbi:MAG: S8 family serine peptidase [Proteobacteria bacterium]|nr:S8 family serine peptidase [Pseudomonadota bacterium]
MAKTSRFEKVIFILIFGFSSFTFANDRESVTAHQPEVQSIKVALQSEQLILATGIFDPKFETLDFSRSFVFDQSSKRYGIIQFQSGRSDFHWLNSQGFTVIQSISHNAYVVNWDQIDKTVLNNNPEIRWFGSYQNGFKLSPNLWQQNRRQQSSYQLLVHAFKDYPAKHLKNLIKKHLPAAKFAHSTVPKGFGQITLELTMAELESAINTLVSLEEIQWVSQYYPEFFVNTEAVSAVQDTATSGGSPGNDFYRPSNQPIFDRGIYGSGQIVGVADSGLDRNEDWFVHLSKGAGVNTALTNAEDSNPPVVGTTLPNNKVFAYWVMPGAVAYDHASAGFHGTHVSGSVAGYRKACIGGCESPPPAASTPILSGYDNDDGMAPNAQILFQDIGSSVGLTGTGSLPMWQQADSAGAKIHSNSYGSSTFGQYVGSDALADEALRGLDDMIILFAAGNDDGPVNTIISPGNAKNVLTVGALNHGNSAVVAGFSNRGPTDDGRLKPDISATGSGIESARGNTNNSNILDTTPQRITKSGTSMSTPITAGATALLRQYFTDGFFPTGTRTNSDRHSPSGTLMKAMLLNGTNTDGGFFSNNIGWGRVWLENILYFDGDARSFRFWELTNQNGLETGENMIFSVNVLAGEEYRATLVWYDLPGPTGSGVTLVNNLDLSLTIGASPGIYLGNQFSGLVSVTGGTADQVNTVEQIRFTAPVTGVYNIRIDATNIPGNGEFDSDKQGFSLVVSGALGSNSPLAIGDPVNLLATDLGLSGIKLDWTVAANAATYEIYRVEGSCLTADLTTTRYIGNSTSNSFTDNTTNGGYQYAYLVRAFNADNQSNLSNCIDMTSAQVCSLAPDFDQTAVKINTNVSGSLCTISLGWDAGTNNCPAAAGVKYNIYRSTIHDFTPTPNNLIATTALGVISYQDNLNSIGLPPGQPQFYIISAEDDTTDGTGPNNGNSSGFSVEIAASPVGTVSNSEGSFIDDVDNLILMDTKFPWSVSSDQASNGTLSYRSAIEGSNNYTPNTCARMFSSIFSIPVSPTGTPQITYQARYNIEPDWDGVVVEISNDGGNNWTDLPPDGGYPDNFGSTGNPPINACAYVASQGAFGGNTADAFQSVNHDLTAYQGQTVQIRWSLSTDPGAEEEGFYLDELQYQNVYTNNMCSMVDLIFQNGFE